MLASAGVTHKNEYMVPFQPEFEWRKFSAFESHINIPERQAPQKEGVKKLVQNVLQIIM